MIGKQPILYRICAAKPGCLVGRVNMFGALNFLLMIGLSGQTFIMSQGSFLFYPTTGITAQLN
jgi:hypothetical protein